VVKIHEVSAEGGGATLCCGMFPSLLDVTHPVTEHSGIVSCDGRTPRCPECSAEATELRMNVEESDNEFSSVMWITVLRVKPCGHQFFAHMGEGLKIELERKDA
jgi:hypothetical protein